jgi:hypothetical protein
MLEATSVTLIGVEVTRARYCSELNRPTPSSPSSSRCGQRRRTSSKGTSARQASGSRMRPVITHRIRFSVSGGT